MMSRSSGSRMALTSMVMLPWRMLRLQLAAVQANTSPRRSHSGVIPTRCIRCTLTRAVPPRRRRRTVATPPAATRPSGRSTPSMHRSTSTPLPHLVRSTSPHLRRRAWRSRLTKATSPRTTRRSSTPTCSSSRYPATISSCRILIRRFVCRRSRNRILPLRWCWILTRLWSIAPSSPSRMPTWSSPSYSTEWSIPSTFGSVRTWRSSSSAFMASSRSLSSRQVSRFMPTSCSIGLIQAGSTSSTGCSARPVLPLRATT
mmetsp:Transcript_35481/g.76991  ORF Transcript_35481/g.76991 Transcript_35481/m.76991 type:complete len:258 (-) Transcript_35481:631-1404(-)